MINIRCILIVAMIALFAACGGGGSGDGADAGEGQGSVTSATDGLNTYFPLYKGMTANYSDGDAIVFARWHFVRSDVELNMISENVLRIESILDSGEYRANCVEDHELIIIGDSVKISKSTVITEWDDDTLGTWSNSWEYNPPVTLVADRNNIETGEVVSNDVSITFLGDPFKIINTVTGEEIYYLPPNESVDFVVTVSEGEPITQENGDVDTYEFLIEWIYGIELPVSIEDDMYTVFDGFSILSSGFRLAKGEGIVAFGDGVIKE